MNNEEINIGLLTMGLLLIMNIIFYLYNLHFNRRVVALLTHSEKLLDKAKEYYEIKESKKEE